MKHTALALTVLSLSACAGVAPQRTAVPARITTSGPAAAAVPASAETATAPHDPRLHAGPAARTPLPSPVVVPLDPTVLAQLPREPVTATAHGVTLRCEGIALSTVLRTADAMPDDPLKGPQLTRYVQVTARDGYRAVFALAELDPTLGNRRVFLTDRCDGKPLPADDGPLRLIAPDEARPARWVRQVKSIVVVVAP